MHSAKTDLIKFLESTSLLKSGNADGAEIIEQLQSFGLERIMLDAVFSIDKYKGYIINAGMLFQKVMNELFIEELLLLAEEAERANIKLVPLKGIILAEELYEPSIIRKSGDIDILVHENDLESLMGICKDLGYVNETGEEITAELASKFLKNPFHVLHFTPLCKKKVVKGKVFNLHLEIHVDLIHKEIFNVKYIDTDMVGNIMNRCTKYKFKGYDIWLLDIHDNIIFLMTHFIKHYMEGIMHGFYNGKIDCTLCINLLHDVALLIDKYHNSINWTTFRAYAREWKVELAIAFAFNIFDRIYPERIPGNFVSDLKSSSVNKYGFLDQACSLLLCKNPTDIVYAHTLELVTDILSIIKKDALSINCQHIKNSKNTSCKDFFIIDEYSPAASNKFGTHLILGRPVSKEDCSVKGYTWWDEDYLSLNIRVYDDCLVFKNEESTTSVQDLLMLYFDTLKREKDKPIAREFLVRPVKEKDGISVEVIDFIKFVDGKAECNTKEVLQEYKFSFNLHEDGYELSLNIPWHVLEIEPVLGLEIPFDVAVFDFDDINNDNKKTWMAWSNVQPAWYDISGYGKLVLT